MAGAASGLLDSDVSQASEHAAQPPTTEKPSTQRPESRQRYRKTEIDMVLEAAGAQLELLLDSDVSQASEHAAQPPTTEKPSTQRPESRQRYDRKETDMMLEAAASQLELMLRYTMLPGDLDDLRLAFEGAGSECTDGGAGAPELPQLSFESSGYDADHRALLQGPVSQSLPRSFVAVAPATRSGARPEPEQPRSESAFRSVLTEPESTSVPTPRVDHEECMPLWWKDMKEKTEKKMAKAKAKKEAQEAAAQTQMRPIKTLSPSKSTSSSSQHDTSSSSKDSTTRTKSSSSSSQHGTSASSKEMIRTVETKDRASVMRSESTDEAAWASSCRPQDSSGGGSSGSGSSGSGLAAPRSEA